MPKRDIPVFQSYICPKCMEVNRIRVTGRPQICPELNNRGELCGREVVQLENWNNSGMKAQGAKP